jgi:hypothetical protein
MNTGIQYNLTGEESRGYIARYHSKPSPLFYNKTKHRCDVSGLKVAAAREALKLDGLDIQARYTIGFEVEKNQLHRGAVREYEIFCGFERDGSCGYEAVTHILPLLPSSQWRMKIFDMMHKAEKIIDDRFSPSNKQCGGHITVAVDGINGDELRELTRKNVGLLMALFRKRLSNSYCNRNSTMLGTENVDRHFPDYHHKYQLALVKGDCLEFRLPSRFESVKQMMRRYEFMYEFINYSVTKPNGTFKNFLKQVRPIVLSMYEGDSTKVDKVFGLAAEFQEFVNTGVLTDKCRPYFTGGGEF